MTSNINLQDYYSKISQMRNKILSRHQTNQAPNTKISQITFSENINTYAPPTRQANITSGVPLAETNDNRRTINCRVKELDDINDKIKSMLAYKRSVQKTNTFAGERSNSIQKHERNIEYKLKMPQSIITEPRNRLDIITDKRDLLRNNQQQYKQSRYVSKYQSYNPTSGNKISQKTAINIGETSFKSYNLSAKQQTFETNMPTLALNKVFSQNYNEELPQVSLKSPERQKLARLLLKQAQIDRKLQQLKQNFEYYSNPEKNSILHAAFQKRGSRLSKEQIESWTKFHSQQSNPFLAIASFSSFDFDEFASQVIEAKQHWEKIIKEALSISNLQKQSFTITQIDPQAKGFITIEDLVCYLNINSTDAYLRNRDLFSLFRRLKRQQHSDFGQNKLRYETFLNFIAK